MIFVLDNSYKLNFIASSNISADAKPPPTNFQRKWIGFGVQDPAPSGSPKTNVKFQIPTVHWYLCLTEATALHNSENSTSLKTILRYFLSPLAISLL